MQLIGEGSDQLGLGLALAALVKRCPQPAGGTFAGPRSAFGGPQDQPQSGGVQALGRRQFPDHPP